MCTIHGITKEFEQVYKICVKFVSKKSLQDIPELIALNMYMLVKLLREVQLVHIPAFVKY